MKKQNQKNERRNSKSNNIRTNLGTAMFVIAIMLFFLRGCGFQQNSAAEIADNNAAYTAEVLGETDARNLDTAAVAVDRIVEVTGQPQTVVETVTETEFVDRPVYVQGPERVVTNTVVEEKIVEKPVYIEVPGETVVETIVETEIEEHKFAHTNTVDNENGTFTFTFTCGTCDEKYEVTVGEETEVHTHDFTVSDEKEATCVADGYKKTNCSCGSSNVEIIEALGHDYVVDETTYVAPTFEAEGKEADEVCTRCADVIEGKAIARLEKEDEEIEEPEHECEFTVVETIEATCEEAGKVVKACECGKENVEVIEAIGHNYVVVEGSAVEPTFETEGKEADEKCTNCGDVIEGKAIDKLVAEHSHAYVEVERVNPTCCENGYVKFECECKDAYTETLEATGHSYVIDETTAVEPTEDSEGKEADEVCQNCGDRIEGSVIPKLEVVHESHKNETYCEFNYLKWGFPEAFGGQCTSYEAYLSYLQANYPDCEIVTGSCQVEVAGELCEGTFVYAE